MKYASAMAMTLFALIPACASTSRDAGAPVRRPPIERFTAFDGRDVDIARELGAGRTVVLVFWQTWCAPCRAEAPRLREAARAHADDIVFVGVVSGPDSTVDETELRRVVADLDLPYAELRDRDGSWSRAFEVSATPTLIALGPDGREAWRGHRAPADWLELHRTLRAKR